MAEYVEREALIAWLKRIQLKDLSDGRGLCRVIFEEDFKHAIRTLPDGAIADVVPVRHGRWETHYRSGTTVPKGVVSGCCDMWNERKTPYCPNCGCRMDGGMEENNG